MHLNDMARTVTEISTDKFKYYLSAALYDEWLESPRIPKCVRIFREKYPNENLLNCREEYLLYNAKVNLNDEDLFDLASRIIRYRVKIVTNRLECLIIKIYELSKK